MAGRGPMELTGVSHYWFSPHPRPACFLPRTTDFAKSRLSWFTREMKAAQKIRPLIYRADQIKPGQVEWLIPHLIPANRLTILDGDPGQGKSFLSLEIAAAVSNGEEMTAWGRKQTDRVGRVMLCNAEDDIRCTTRRGCSTSLAGGWRGSSMGLITVRISRWQGSRPTGGGRANRSIFSFPLPPPVGLLPCPLVTNAGLPRAHALLIYPALRGHTWSKFKGR